MSEALLAFDDPPRSGQPADNATSRIADALRGAGVEATALYDEALALAREGHLGQAASRLQMLVCLDPEDASALLLLARVHAAQRRFGDALGRLDAAVELGALPPAGLREQIEAGIREERAREEEHRARIARREQSEIQSLRTEARTLRSDNVRLETEVTDSMERELRWKWLAAGVSLFATVVILAIALLGAKDEGAAVTEIAPEAAAAAPTEEAVAASPTASPAASPTASTVAKIERPPAAVPAAAPTAQASGPREHVVGSGDTLYKLSKRYYGDATQWEKIAKANKALLKGRKDLSLGMRLAIPE